jgi:cell division GTPase FtsZ
MDELGEITDYMYDVASDDALIIRGLSQDDSLSENISVIVIATGFEANSIFQPYKSKTAKQVITLSNKNVIPPSINPQKNDETFTVHEKGKKSIMQFSSLNLVNSSISWVCNTQGVC